MLPALHAFQYLLQGAAIGIVVDFHLRIAGKLIGIGFEMSISQSFEHQRQAAPDDIVQIHQVTLLALIGQTDKAPAKPYGQFEESIVEHTRVFALPYLYRQINVFVVPEIERLDRREPNRDNGSAQFRLIE